MRFLVSPWAGCSLLGEEPEEERGRAKVNRARALPLTDSRPSGLHEESCFQAAGAAWPEEHRWL